MTTSTVLVLVILASFYFQDVEMVGSCDCPLTYEPLGCYNDINGDRAMGDYILTDRDPSIAKWSGIKVDWKNFATYLPGFICRCAQKAKEKGYTVFGVQYFGECWSSSDAESTYDRHGLYDSSEDTENVKGCVSKTFQPCDDNAHCVGRQWTNYVYKLTSQCEDQVMAVGCYKDRNSPNRAMSDYITNDRDITIDNFSGTRIKWGWFDSYIQGDFLCRCAQLAKEKGYKVFGLQYYGECWGSSDALDTYFKYGEGYSRCRDTCYGTCLPSSQYCVGKQWRNFVYRFATSVEDCAVPNNQVGCYEALSSSNYQLLITDADPISIKFSGYSRIVEGAPVLTERYPELACSCAFKAKEEGFTHIALKTNGDCFGTNEVGTTTSSACYSDYDNTESCASDATTNCGGGDDTVWVISVTDSDKRSITHETIKEEILNDYIN